MFWKKIITTNRQTEELKSGIETWVVEWTQRYGYSGIYTRQAFQGFADKGDADKFANSLRQAIKLLGHEADKEVKVYKPSNGL